MTNPIRASDNAGDKLPMPGERFHRGIVVASVWQNDEIERATAMVLLVRDAPPYYAVDEIEWASGDWGTVDVRLHPNIVPAVEDYQQNGGDY